MRFFIKKKLKDLISVEERVYSSTIFFIFFLREFFFQSVISIYASQLVIFFFFPLVFPAEMLETSKTRLRDQEKYLAYGSEKYATCTLQCDKLMCDLNSMNLIFE